MKKKTEKKLKVGKTIKNEIWKGSACNKTNQDLLKTRSMRIDEQFRD